MNGIYLYKHFAKKYQGLQQTAKAAVWFTLCNFLLKGISFIMAPLFAKYLSPYEYGKVSIYGAYEQLILIFATLELSLGVYQLGMLKYKEDLKTFTQSLLLLSNIITVIMLFVMTIFVKGFISKTETSTGIILLMFLYFLVQPAYNCWLNQKRFVYDYKPAVIATLVFSILTTIVPLAAVIFISRTANVRIETMLVINICFCLPFYVKSINFSSLHKCIFQIRSYWKYMLTFQFPLALHSLSYLVLAQADRVMIGEMVGKSQAAFYSVAYSLAYAIVIIIISVNQVLKPWRYQKMESKDYKAIGKVTNILLFIIATAIVLFILIAPEMMRFLYSEKYYEAVWTIPSVSLSVLFLFLYNSFADIESYFSRTKYIMYASVMCAILNIILNFWGITKFGYIACGYTTLFSYVVFAMLHYIFMRKVLTCEKLENNIFDIKMIVFISIGTILICALIMLTYPYPVIRYVVVALIVIYGFKNRVKIFLIFKLMKSCDDDS